VSIERSVHKRIVAIIGDLPAIEKNDSGQGVPYKFRGVETLVGHLSNLLARHGVIIVPSTNLISVGPVEGRDGKPMGGWTDVVLAVDWRIYGAEGDFIEARTYGIGRDNSDKGANKAQTQAFKYLLMELFGIGDKRGAFAITFGAGATASSPQAVGVVDAARHDAGRRDGHRSRWRMRRRSAGQRHKARLRCLPDSRLLERLLLRPL
jgi:hypothetical protein